MKIRNIEYKDLESLGKLYFQFWGDKSELEKMQGKYKELENNDNYIFLAAEVDGRLAGSVMGIVCSELYGDCRPFMVLEDLIVDKNFRKKGIGKALVRKLEEEAEKRNCCQIIFITETDRHDAVAFYESVGYDSNKNRGFKKKISQDT